MRQRRPVIVALTFTALLATAAAVPAVAEDGWKPFAEKDQARPKKAAPAPGSDRPFLPPMISSDRPVDPYSSPNTTTRQTDNAAIAPGAVSAQPLPALDTKSQAVERAELTPVLAGDGSALPLELWRGLDLAATEQQFARLDLPPRSPALHNLWRRLLSAKVPAAAGSDGRFHVLKAEALYRSGLLKEMGEALGPAGDGTLAAALKARAALAIGDRPEACSNAKAAAARKGELPKGIGPEMVMIAGWCAAADGQTAGAGLAADLAREAGADAPVALAALDALAAGQKSQMPAGKKIGVLEYRLHQLLGTVDPAGVLQQADPALIALLVQDSATDTKLRLAAAESAARLNILDPPGLADLYRAQAFSQGELSEPLAGRPDPLMRRALLFKAAEAERTPFKRTRIIRALLDDARRSGLYLPTLRMLTKTVEEIPRAPEIGWFAETAIEVAIASGRLELARGWVGLASGADRSAGGSLAHWLALVDIADPELKSRRGESLASVEELALRGRFSADLLHRLATVLDALDYNVPIPLWDAANRAPQPQGGHLPETGVLPELLDASKKREFGRTVLLAMRTLGPNGAEGAHMIALGDAIRALKRSGLESDARRVALEALFAGWPRGASQ